MPIPVPPGLTVVAALSEFPLLMTVAETMTHRERLRRDVKSLTAEGMLTAYVKWQPEALWALIGKSFANHGYVTRSGYAHQERGFLQWEWEPQGADNVEWLIIAERSHLEFLIAEEAARLV